MATNTSPDWQFRGTARAARAMGVYDIDHLTLTRPVMNQIGEVQIPAGTKLTGAHFGMFDQIGIDECWVECKGHKLRLWLDRDDQLMVDLIAINPAA